ncbi:DNA-binding protein [Pseudomonas cannabina]|uniref:Cointegrate resolution protein T n=1 Tax=Pseudomonas cannabina TaxID=86840 RepID=A0A3M3K4B7_PSECA|nr:DNA-binding protein [Pseudomonas cannabina]KAA8715915.1 integrase [Pseudomonas cannabina]RMN17091.1 Cointegrate resolution protein T [Pseudomonas cannabina]SDQ84532.1 replication region DNA-binding N-term [Pseudomonas cannabina]
MARGGVNKALVQKARVALLARGENPSIDAVRIEMGNTGSKTTIHRYLKELDTAHASAPDINEELTELVARLAQRLEEQARERIDQAHEKYETSCNDLRQQLSTAQQQIDELQKHLQQRDETLEQQAAALLHTQQTLQSTQTEQARLLQARLDLEARLQDKDGQIGSLEEKHQHAREALEHYRNSIKDQREHEQQRHEGQVQQLQMELRQAQQSLAMRQEDITQLNRDNERLLAENRTAQRELHRQQDLLSKATLQATASAEQQQQARTHCALLEDRLGSLQDEAAALRQNLTDAQQQNRVLELLLTKKEVALENLQHQTRQAAKPKASAKKPPAST